MSLRYPAGRITLSINPLLVPDAPATATATAATYSTASVAFTAPTNVGGSAVTSYSIVPASGGTAVTGSTSPITVTGLSEETAYTFQVIAANAYGAGPIITSNSVTTPSSVTNMVSDWYNGATQSNGNRFEAIFVDSGGDIYVSGRQQITGTNDDFYTAKFSGVGSTITWQRKLHGGGDYDYFRCNTVDSSGNVYSGGYSNYATGLVTKHDSSGAIQWQKSFTDSNYSYNVWSLKINSSGDLFAMIAVEPGIGYPSNNYITILKINASTGALTAFKNLKIGTEQQSPALLSVKSLAIDSSSNVYIAGFNRDASYNQQGVLAKFNSSFTEQWTVKIDGPLAGVTTISACATDSSGNVYLVGNQRLSNQSSTDTNGWLLKFNTSGVIQWQKSFNYSGSNGVGGSESLCIDSSGNVYVATIAGNYASPFRFQGVIAKYNSSGTLQWLRTLTDNTQGSGGHNFKGIAVNSNGSAIFVSSFLDANNSNSGGGKHGSVFIFPTNGTKTGTYTVNGRSMTYAAVTPIETTPTYDTTSTWTFSNPGASWSSGNSSLTETAGNLTAAVTTI